MRIVRVLVGGQPSWGVLRGEDVHLIVGSPFEDVQRHGPTIALSTTSLLPPATPSKIFAVGRNYADHAAELGLAVGDEPAIFMKPPSSLLAPGAAVLLPAPDLSSEVEHEAELAVVVGAVLKGATPDEAAEAVFGFTCADDVSARDLQRTDIHITRAKGFDTFCPLGPWIETRLPPRPDVAVTCRVNGDVRQSARTLAMRHDVPALLSYISQWATLLPGDVVLTGTPAGTSQLRDGDEVEIDIEGVGQLRHRVRSHPLEE